MSVVAPSFTHTLTLRIVQLVFLFYVLKVFIKIFKQTCFNVFIPKSMFYHYSNTINLRHEGHVSLPCLSVCLS